MNIMNRLIIGIFLCFLFGIAFMNVISEDVNFSEAENRVLSKMPEFTLHRFITGIYTEEFEKYLSDQFVNKEFWTGLKTSAIKATMKQDNNGVYFGKDGYLFERFEKPKEQVVQNSMNISYFSEKAKGVASYLMLVPTSIEIYPEKLPLFVQTESQKEALDSIKHKLSGSIKWIDTYESLVQSKREQIFFRTDHHWTTRGAYAAYKIASKEMGFNAYDIDDFTIETVSTNFYGTYYAKANDHSIKADTIEVFKPMFNVSYDVDIEDNHSSMDSLYNLDFLEKRDQYSLFLDGNHSKVIIKSNVNNDRKLLVIKDSYAHAFIPFLANHFDEIHMIDLRYYHANLHDYLGDNEINDVLFLYNVATFSQDTNLVWLRQ